MAAAGHVPPLEPYESVLCKTRQANTGISVVALEGRTPQQAQWFYLTAVSRTTTRGSRALTRWQAEANSLQPLGCRSPSQDASNLPLSLHCRLLQRAAACASRFLFACTETHSHSLQTGSVRGQTVATGSAGNTRGLSAGCLLRAITASSQRQSLSLI